MQMGKIVVKVAVAVVTTIRHKESAAGGGEVTRDKYIDGLNGHKWTWA